MHKKGYYGILLQDIGLLAFLTAVFTVAIVVYKGGSELLLENTIMALIMMVVIVLETFSRGIAALVTAGSQLICFSAYKLFNLYAFGTVIGGTSFMWIILPLAALGSIKLFCSSSKRLENENSILKRQVEELVMVDPLTGLYNLRSFYHDIGRHISYAQRNKLPMTLMIMQLRYGEELKKVLSRSHYDMLKQRLVQIVSDAIRSEDRLYSVDEEGSLAVILTCDDAGSELVRNRIRKAVSEKSAFDGITDTSIKVDLQIAFMQYNKDMGNDMMSYKKSVEKELQYDV